jgi:indole-3-acetate monooxygenase
VSIFESSPLQRALRDVHVAMRHAMVVRKMLEPIGRLTFGLDTDVATF